MSKKQRERNYQHFRSVSFVRTGKERCELVLRRREDAGRNVLGIVFMLTRFFLSLYNSGLLARSHIIAINNTLHRPRMLLGWTKSRDDLRGCCQDSRACGTGKYWARTLFLGPQEAEG